MSTRRAYFQFYPRPALTHDGYTETETINGTVTFHTIDGPPNYRNPRWFTLATPSGVTGMACASFGKRVALPDGEYVDLAVRVRIATGNNHATGRVSLAIGRGIEVQPDPVTHGPPYTISNGGFGSLTDQMLMASLLGDGTIELGAVTDGSYGSIATASGPDSTYRGAAAGVWLRLVRTPVAVAVWWGVGTSEDALPKRWTCALVSSDVSALTASTPARTLRVSVETSAGISGGFSAEVRDCAWMGARAGLDLVSYATMHGLEKDGVDEGEGGYPL